MANTRCFRSVCLCHQTREEEERTEETGTHVTPEMVIFPGEHLDAEALKQRMCHF